MLCLRNFCAKFIRIATFALLASTVGIDARATGTTPAHQDLEQLRALVEEYLIDQYHQRFNSAKTSVSRLDPRLKLAHCSVLEFDVRDIAGNGGAISVKAQCTAPTPWTVYIGAQVDVFRDIVVTRRAVRRGEIVTQADVTTQSMNTAQLRSGYISDPSLVLGMEVRRNLDPAEPLRDALLAEPLAINRGQIITLASRSGAIEVNTLGEALSNGHIGDQIRVRNLSSERVVYAHITEPGIAVIDSLTP